MSSAYLNDQFFMKWADDVSKASTCAKIKVGSILVRDRRVLSLGYNGTAAGMAHCIDHFSGERSRETLGEEEFMRQHRIYSEENEIHSESNMITSAWKNRVEVKGATIYSLFSPCFGCSKLIIQAEITRVVYRDLYDQRAVDYLRSAGVTVEVIHEL
jgi:dCMP deaminase